MNKETIDISRLEAYLDGVLSEREMYFVEREALEDPFIFDALEGLSNSPRRNEVLSALQLQMRRRIEQAPLEKRRWFIQTHRLSIAATAAMLFIAAGVMYWMKTASFKEEPQMPVEVTLRSSDGNSTIQPQSSVPVVGPVISQSDAANKSANKVRKDVVAAADVAVLSKAGIASNKQEILVGEAVGMAASVPVSDEVVSRAARTAGVAKSAVINEVLSGEIVDFSTKLPIEGVKILRLSDNSEYFSTKGGEFRIQLLRDNKSGMYRFSAKGYISQDVNLNVYEEAKISLKKEI